MITVNLLGETAGIRHAFFTRAGGVSRGIYASLNCGLGSGDDPDAVTTNRARAMSMLDVPPGSLATAYQVHSNRVAVLQRPWPREQAQQVDGLVTDRPGVALGILTADCAPVLLADAEAGVIGAAHAGWRGALDGVLDATIDAMCEIGAGRARIVAAIGPAIGKLSYEVGAEFAERFLAASPGNSEFFAASTRDGHFLFDLPGYVAGRLRQAGIGRVTASEADTCRDAERFFSYRRTCLEGEKDYGRGLSAIVLTN